MGSHRLRSAIEHVRRVRLGNPGSIQPRHKPIVVSHLKPKWLRRQRTRRRKLNPQRRRCTLAPHGNRQIRPDQIRIGDDLRAVNLHLGQRQHVVFIGIPLAV